ncbi:MAG: hypothetical protein JW912_04050 [Sedimentisphaerales bacterium]|nr:hypothetical protein [Sedimentisphaerales bacterium]
MNTYRNRIFVRITVAILIFIIFTCGCVSQQRQSVSGKLNWSRPTMENRPWTRWWWQGSAVDKENLTYLLSQYQQAGIGGVEICPIYGVKGYEDKFLDFLSPEWMNMLEHTLKEGKRLGIGIDMTTGTGWPFGGPMVDKNTASSSVILKSYEMQEGKLADPLPKEPLEYLAAVSQEGQRIDITDKVEDGKLNWTSPEGQWKLYAVAVKSPVQKVKRSAPGGEGYVLDPYSTAAMDSYLKVFDEAFGGYKGPMPRAQFHDSFEYYGANWTTNFFDEFKSRCGYDLRDHIEALSGDGSEDTVARVQCDYHQTINELHLDYVQQWTKWSNSKGSQSRNQAHGAPGNLVDIYAASDIPETEIFRVVDEKQIPMLKLSSSAAHLKGSTYASAESFTWLNDHFQTSLADLKLATDFLFLTGVNHIFFHGIPYSPKESMWPGWQFYASVNFGPQAGLWHDLPAFNAYVTRCQSILQAGKPDNDVLLYLPIYDFWQKNDKLHMAFTLHNQDEWLHTSAFYRAAMSMWRKGYTYDAVSDQFLAQAECKNGKVIIGGNEYAAVVIPDCHLIPVDTMKNLLTLAKEGATILFEDSLPDDVPGLSNLHLRQTELQKMLNSVILQLGEKQKISFGKGTLMAAPLETMLAGANVPRESAMDSGIRFVRRNCPEGFNYLLVNRSPFAFDGWMALGKAAKSALLMDPLFDDRIGTAAMQNSEEATKVYIQLEQGQSLVLRTFTDKAISTPAWKYSRPSGFVTNIEGAWDIEFIDGGPVLPQSYQAKQLKSWTTRNDEEAKRFFGTGRYTIKFDKPSQDADDWMLDLGSVYESARVSLNGKLLAVLWSKPFRLHIGQYLLGGENTLEVEVTNLAANRIRDMDQRGVNWKYFYDINVVNVKYKPFDASDWPLQDSGLLGPVRLFPLKLVSLDDKPKPTVFIIGDSTVKNSTKGLLGWGNPIADHFDMSKINVRNLARGGCSSRTYQTEGLWDEIVKELKPGDFVLMQFGHNDGGPMNTGRARASIKGIGNQTQEVVMEATGEKEIVHTYGWYMRKYITDTKAKGAVPIVLSPIPRNMWKDGVVARASGDYGKWAGQAAKAKGAFFIDLNELIAVRYEKEGQEKVSSEYFLKDHTHTTTAGAKLNAKIVVQGINGLSGCALSDYIILHAE